MQNPKAPFSYQDDYPFPVLLHHDSVVFEESSEIFPAWLQGCGLVYRGTQGYIYILIIIELA